MREETLDKREGLPFGRYRLIAKLAVGGMAELFIAYQKGVGGFNKKVVIKCILPYLSQNEEFIDMFLAEARLAAHLNHPNVVQIYEVDQIDGIYYMSMEYIPGQNLREVTRRLYRQLGDNQSPPYDLLAAIFAQAAAGLDYVHRATDQNNQPLGLIHRDISPNNLILSYEGQVKIVDFGVAKARTQERETEVGVLKGRLSYMSPEQVSGEKLDGRSDIFSLGVVLYELTTNRRLFRRKSEPETIQALLSGPIPSPRVFYPDYPPALEKIVFKMLQRDRELRYQSAAEVQSDLEEFLASQGKLYGPSRLSELMAQLFPKEIEKDRAGIYDNPVTVEDLINLSRGSYRILRERAQTSASYSLRIPSVVDPVSSGQRELQISPYGTSPSQSELRGLSSRSSSDVMPDASVSQSGLRELQSGEDPTVISDGHLKIGGDGEELSEQVKSSKKSPIFVGLSLIGFFLLAFLSAVFFLKMRERGGSSVVSQLKRAKESFEISEIEAVSSSGREKGETSEGSGLSSEKGETSEGSGLSSEKGEKERRNGSSRLQLGNVREKLDKGAKNLPQVKGNQKRSLGESPVGKLGGKEGKRGGSRKRRSSPIRPVRSRVLLSGRGNRKRRSSPVPHRSSSKRRRGKILPFSEVRLPEVVQIEVYRRGSDGRRVYTSEHLKLCRRIERELIRLLGSRYSVMGVTAPWRKFVRDKFKRGRKYRYKFYPLAVAYIVYTRFLRGESKSEIASALARYQKRYRFKRYLIKAKRALRK